MVLVVVVPSSSRDYTQFTDPSTGRRMLYLDDADDDVTPLVATTEESF